MAMSETRQTGRPGLWHGGLVDMDPQRCWQAVEAADPRFDGWVYCAVTSTGVYCRPSCPARTPKRANVRFYATPAAAQAGGFRACKRCRPDATPGSPEWDRRADLAGRAMRLIADGVVDRDGVGGLASRLGYTVRHVNRELLAVAGAGPLALARAQRAQTARILLETTEVSITDVAFASGFQSVRQFNATIQEVFASTPGQLRLGARRYGRPLASGPLVLRLPYRAPLDGAGLVAFLQRRAVPGVEEVVDGAYRRSLGLPHGAGTVELTPGDGHVLARFWLDDLGDLAAAVQRCRILFDLDSDPWAVAEALGGDALLGASVAAMPGRRIPGTVDGHELAVRAVLGQQVSLAGAATIAGRLVHAYGEPLAQPLGAVTHVFPTAAALAGADPEKLAMPEGRRRCLLSLARALAVGQVVIDAGADRDDALQSLQSLPGIGPWTLNYIAMRALRDPDAYLPSDLGIRHALERLGQDARPGPSLELAERWRPYRSYAVQHLWATLAGPATAAAPSAA
jgi:AraC family transcriptional regulator, regulatory protein of adaptative response / DNA-3-methyladenine glycosylase II